MSKPTKSPTMVSFVSQKGGVGKSALARLLAVGAAHRGQKVLLADFDLEQLTCVGWNAIRRENGVNPKVDARAFKSLKKLRKNEEGVDFIVADTRGLADDLTRDVAEESDVVFMPTGASGDDLRPTLALARQLADHGADGRLALVLSKVGRSRAQLARANDAIDDSGFERLSARWPMRDGFAVDLDKGRAGRETRNAVLRAMAERMEDEMFARIAKARPRG